MNVLRNFKHWLSLIRFSHTAFALPFAVVGFFLGLEHGGKWSSSKFLWVVLCMTSARTAAMAFNRYADSHWDALNERTRNREIPSGIIRRESALALVIAASILFFFFSFMLNRLCFYLSPVALLIVLGYSYTKRFTAACHLILGLGLSLAPVGAYLAVREAWNFLPVLFGFLVLCWVSGFDILYALHDAEFDRSHGLFSIPAKWGIQKSIWISRFLHGCAVFTLIAIGVNAPWGWWYWLGALVFSVLMLYQHTLVKANDFSRINLAFGTLNGWASVILGCFILTDIITN